jgi:uncharacterized protein YecT (DUF1311 family)
VAWNGGCFNRNEWRADAKSSPAGVILIPDGEDLPRCTPCHSDKVTKQQPMNCCAGVLSRPADRELDVGAFSTVLKEFLNQARDLDKAQAAWVKWRDLECEAEAVRRGLALKSTVREAAIGQPDQLIRTPPASPRRRRAEASRRRFAHQ